MKHTEILFKILAVGAAWAGSFFYPIYPYMVLVISLVFLDLYTGIKAARKREETIHSKGLRKSVSKIGMYFLAILASRGMEVVFLDGRWLQEHVPLTYMVAGFIAMVEFQSNIENIGELTGIDIWGKIKSVLNKWLNKNTGTDEGK